MEEDLFLIYVHKIGFDHQSKYFYEFIFGESTKNVDGEDWDSYPASGNPLPPHDNLITQVGKVEIDFKLDVIQDNELFSMYDSVDGVISLAWENIDGLDSYPENRLIFPFGMTIKQVSNKLYEKDIRMELQKELDDE
tara:strand:+ start:718 stop:1128 length:411 start_codon:yes stop_codon:yes gene_type:complete